MSAASLCLKGMTDLRDRNDVRCSSGRDRNDRNDVSLEAARGLEAADEEPKSIGLAYIAPSIHRECPGSEVTVQESKRDNCGGLGQSTDACC